MNHPHALTFECHITVAYMAKDSRDRLEYLGAENNWKTSYIQNDPILGNKPFFYFTKHDRDYDTLFKKMNDMADEIARDGYEVLRRKIEAIVFDTKMGSK
jgi:hypothetical protein